MARFAGPDRGGHVFRCVDVGPFQVLGCPIVGVAAPLFRCIPGQPNDNV